MYDFLFVIFLVAISTFLVFTATFIMDSVPAKIRKKRPFHMKDEESTMIIYLRCGRRLVFPLENKKEFNEWFEIIASEGFLKFGNGFLRCSDVTNMVFHGNDLRKSDKIWYDCFSDDDEYDKPKLFSIKKEE